MSKESEPASSEQRHPTLSRILGFAVPMVGPMAAAVAMFVAMAPFPKALLFPPPQSLELMDRNGLLLREVLDDGDRFTRPIGIAEIPRNLVLATLAAEDKRFYHHPGVDPLAIARAMRSAVRHRRIKSGGSTITQQLVKITANRHRPRTPGLKLVEAIAAMKLDAIWTKDRILEAYLNRLDYGNLRIGCAAAARFYFDKQIADLSVAEAAQLAALPRSPARLNPLRDPSAAREAQQLVLTRMLHNGWLTQSQYIHALAEPINPAGRRSVFRTPHFADYALGLAKDQTGPTATTIDLALNRFVEQKLRSRLAALESKRASNGAAVVIDNRTAELLALVGSENYFRPGVGQVNAATARRSPGSALKPFTYVLALQNGLTPASVLADIPSDFPTPTGSFRPVNYDQSFRGPVRLRSALANSLNVPAVRLLADTGGPSRLIAALKSCGLTTFDHAPDHYGLGLTIGNAEVRLLELANAYACLSRLGIYRPLRVFLNAPRHGVADSPDGQRIFDPAATWLLADILSDDFARAPSFGPRSSLAMGFPVACKTGTSSDFRDNWALGFTPEFTVGVWIGNFDGTPMNGISGASGSAPLLRDIFCHLNQTRGTSWYSKPTHITRCRIHSVTGKRMANGSGGIMEHFIVGRIPAPESPSDYDTNGRIILASEYAAWIADARPPGFALSQSSESTRLAITSPRNGATYFLDPDLPGSNTLPLRIAGDRPVSWHSTTLPIETRNNGPSARLIVGRHQITATDPITGRQIQSSIEVRGM